MTELRAPLLLLVESEWNEKRSQKAKDERLGLEEELEKARNPYSQLSGQG